jgi:hypothetical protein
MRARQRVMAGALTRWMHAMQASKQASDNASTQARTKANVPVRSSMMVAPTLHTSAAGVAGDISITCSSDIRGAAVRVLGALQSQGLGLGVAMRITSGAIPYSEEQPQPWTTRATLNLHPPPEAQYPAPLTPTSPPAPSNRASQRRPPNSLPHQHRLQPSLQAGLQACAQGQSRQA